MAETGTALGSLGSDLAFSVSFGIGRELLDAAHDAQISEDELIACVLILSIVFSALPRMLKLAAQEARNSKLCKAFGLSDKKPSSSSSQSSPLPPPKLSATESGLLSFGTVLVDITRRIAVSLSVQLLASNVRAKQPNRSVRIVSLLSVAVFFLFLESSSSIAVKTRND